MKMTDRAEIERLLNQTGRTLEGLPTEAEYMDAQTYGVRCEEIDKALADGGFDATYPCMLHQSDVIELLIGALRDALEKMPRWISVEERLPKDRQVVYMNTSNGRTFKGVYLFHTGFERYKHGDGWTSVKNVAYWTTLPELPKENADESN